MPTLELLHWNDVHGRFAALSRLSARAKALKTSQAHPVLLLDAGDVEEMSVRISALSYGVAAWRVLRAAGVDAAVVGNGGLLRYGPTWLPKYADALESAPLVANAELSDGTDLPGTASSTLIEVPGVKVGVIGVTAFVRGYGDWQLTERPAVSVVPAEAASLRGQGADVVVLLSHCGLDEDQRLASELAGCVDLIVGGHSHHLLPDGDLTSGVPIVHAGEYAEHLGRVTLEIGPGGVDIVDVQTERVPNDAPQDPDVLAVLAACERDLADWLAEPIGKIPAALDFALDRDCAVVSLLAEALLAHVPGDLAMVLAMQCDDGLRSGPVRRRDVRAATSSPANPATATLTGAQLRDMIVKGRSPQFAASTSRVSRGRPFGLLHLAGATESAGSILVGGEPIDETRRYRVTGTDLELSPYGELLAEAPADLTVLVPTIMPELLEEHIRRHSNF